MPPKPKLPFHQIVVHQIGLLLPNGLLVISMNILVLLRVHLIITMCDSFKHIDNASQLLLVESITRFHHHTKTFVPIQAKSAFCNSSAISSKLAPSKIEKVFMFNLSLTQPNTVSNICPRFILDGYT